MSKIKRRSTSAIIRLLTRSMACIFMSLPCNELAEEESPPVKDAITAQNPFMQKAIEEALEGIELGHGGPFGCVIVKNGGMIASDHNQVLKKHDPTCHGEMEAIRKASQILGTHDLSGCELYTTGEPCPMCLAACLWANISKVYYGCTIADNARLGFKDADMDTVFGGGRKSMKGYLIEMDRQACLQLFDHYLSLHAQRY
ncbi:MAG: nucleoside deaminase [Mailhella sp.]|nr:nucleoside deaminase [Mailhella sp.]